MNNIRYKYNIDGTFVIRSEKTNTTFETHHKFNLDEKICYNKSVERFTNITSPTQILTASAAEIKAIPPAQIASLLQSIPIEKLAALPVEQIKNLYSILTPSQLAAIPPTLIAAFKAKLTPTTSAPTTAAPTTAAPTTTAPTNIIDIIVVLSTAISTCKRSPRQDL